MQFSKRKEKYYAKDGNTLGEWGIDLWIKWRKNKTKYQNAKLVKFQKHAVLTLN